MKSLVQALPRIPLLVWPPRCANKDCRRSVIAAAIHGRAEGISVQDQWFCGPDCFENGLAGTFAGLDLSTAREPAVHRNRLPLGLTLLSRGHLSEHQLRTALDQHRATGVRFGDILLHLGLATEEQLTAALAIQWGHPVFPLRTTTIETGICIPTRLLELNHMLPVYYGEASKRLLIGFAEGVNYRTLDAVAEVLSCSPSPCIIASSEYRKRLESILGQKHRQEVAFDGKSSPREMARVVRSYAVQIHAEEMRFAACGDHLWARLSGRRHQMDILFRLGHE